MKKGCKVFLFLMVFLTFSLSLFVFASTINHNIPTAPLTGAKGSSQAVAGQTMSYSFAQFSAGQSPVAVFTYTPEIPQPGETISFDASASYAPDGSIVQYTWDFGDGNVTATTGPVVTYSYPIDGSYTVQLTVTDNNGQTASAAEVVQVQKDVSFRVCFYGTVTPISNAQVTVYYKNGTAWTKVPATTNYPGVTVVYDNMTQPHQAWQYRNPAFTASILFLNATNIEFDIHPSSTEVYFKFQWGPYVAYWPNNDTVYYRYDSYHGKAVAYNFEGCGKPRWDSSAATYVIKAANINSGGCRESSPIVATILCPPPSQQWYLNVKTDPTGITTIPGQGWYANGSSATLTAPTYVNVSSNTRYRFNYWDVDGTSRGSSVNPITVLMTANHTATAHYVTQYYLTVSSAHDVPIPSSSWFDNGTNVAASVNSPVPDGSGKRYVCTGWTGTGSVPVTGTSNTTSFAITQPSNITWKWKTQYQLTVSSAYDSPTPTSGWFDSGVNVTASVTSPYAGSAGTRYVCTGWTGTGSVPSLGSAATVTFTITNCSSITWNWKTQYQVVFDESGVGSDFAGTVATIDGVNYSRSGLPTAPQFWWDQASNHSFSFVSPLGVNGGENYVWTSTTGLSSLQSGNLTITASGTVIGNYVLQNRITFDQNGIGSTFAGTVVIIDGVNYNVSQLPVWFAWLNNSVHSFAFQSPLVVGANTKYIWTSTTGLSNLQNSSITVTAYGSIVGNYKTQYQLTVSSVYGSVGGQGWYDSGLSAYATVSPLTVAGSSGTQYVFTGWSGDASGSTSPSNAIVMSGPKAATANWKTQYQLILATDPSGAASPSGAGWYDVGTNAAVSTPAFVNITVGSSRYRFNGWTTGDVSEITNPLSAVTTVLIDKTKTVTATYVVQYNVTFKQTGVGPEILGTVVVIDGVNQTLATLPASYWWDNNTVHTFAFQSPLVGSRYAWTNTTGLSTSQSGTLTILTAGNVTGNYRTQYYLTVNIDPSGVPATIPGQGWYDVSSSVSLNAPSASGWSFSYWDVDGTSQGSTNPIVVNMNSAHNATAHYIPGPVQSLTVSISPMSVTMTLGSSVTFTSTVSGGTAPYAYQWYLDGNPVSGANSGSWMFTPPTGGVYYVYLKVTDAASNTAQSGTARVEVIPPPPVGGFSVSMEKLTPLSCLAAYMGLLALLGAVLCFTKRKRK